VSRIPLSTWLAGALVLTGLLACNTPLSSESMMPGAVDRAPQRGSRTLRVAPVIGAESQIPLSLLVDNTYYVRNEELQTALVDALDDSRLFRSVASDGAADFELSTRVVSQDCQPAAEVGSRHCVLVVNYHLREIATARDVWSDTLVTRGHADRGAEGWPGAARKARSAAAQRSLTEMLTKLSEALAAP
jgi:hypothetical protein